MDVLLSLDANTLPPQDGDGSAAAAAAGPPAPAPPGSPEAVGEVVPVTLSCLAQLHSLRISVPEDLRPAEARRQVVVQVGVGLCVGVGGWGRG